MATTLGHGAPEGKTVPIRVRRARCRPSVAAAAEFGGLLGVVVAGGERGNFMIWLVWPGSGDCKPT